MMQVMAYFEKPRRKIFGLPPKEWGLLLLCSYAVAFGLNGLELNAAASPMLGGGLTLLGIARLLRRRRPAHTLALWADTGYLASCSALWLMLAPLGIFDSVVTVVFAAATVACFFLWWRGRGPSRPDKANGDAQA